MYSFDDRGSCCKHRGKLLTIKRTLETAMRMLFLSLLIIFGLSSQISADGAGPDARALIGTWKVDLRPTPDADAYYQEFVVHSIDGSTFTGMFYGTEIRHGRINTDWDGVHFAFVTNDGSGDYNTSGILKDGKLSGTTHSLGREFLAVWTAERQEK